MSFKVKLLQTLMPRNNIIPASCLIFPFMNFSLESTRANLLNSEDILPLSCVIFNLMLKHVQNKDEIRLVSTQALHL